MSDKKNIDRLFQEKFKDFEVTPDEAVWEKIKDRKNKRRRLLVVPFWYKVAGVAAILAVMLMIGYASLYQEPAETIVDSEQENINIPKTEEEINTTIIDNDALVISDKKEENPPVSNNTKAPSSTTKNKEHIDSFKNSQNTTTASQSKQKLPDPKIEENKSVIPKTETKIATTIPANDSAPKSEMAHIANKKDTGSKNVKRNTNAISNQQQDLKSEKENSLFAQPDIKESTSKDRITERGSDAKNNTDQKDNNEVVTDEENSDHKKSIFDAIAKEEDAIVEKTEASSKKWNVAPNVAPVYYDAIGNGSSLNSEFSDNAKSGEVNFSYGIQVAYEINDRLSIRSGIHKLDLSYNTEDIGFEIPTIGRSNLQNVIVSDYNGQSNNVLSPDISSESLVQSQNPGVLNHRIGYIEVPLEIKYDIVDTKIGMHMIGGVSTLFLNEDDVSVIAGGFETDRVDREFNVNDVSFSGNIGFGVNYKLSNEFQINLEPIFKYQFNGFKNSSSDFTPYSFGIYTGVNFRF